MNTFRRNIPHYFNGFYWSIANAVEYLKVFKVYSDDQNVNIRITQSKEKIKTNITAHVMLHMLIIVFKNIYQLFRPIPLLRHMLITNQYVQQIIL